MIKGYDQYSDSLGSIVVKYPCLSHRRRGFDSRPRRLAYFFF